ncbi:hypothetical protein ACVIW2_007534 [Bradyrhizobium huanghuaihaiense]
MTKRGPGLAVRIPLRDPKRSLCPRPAVLYNAREEGSR